MISSENKLSESEIYEFSHEDTKKIMNYEEGGRQEIIEQLLIAQETRSVPTEDDIIENKISESEVCECDYEVTKANEQRRRRRRRMPRDN